MRRSTKLCVHAPSHLLQPPQSELTIYAHAPTRLLPPQISMERDSSDGYALYIRDMMPTARELQSTGLAATLQVGADGEEKERMWQWVRA